MNEKQLKKIVIIQVCNDISSDNESEIMMMNEKQLKNDNDNDS